MFAVIKMHITNSLLSHFRVSIDKHHAKKKRCTELMCDHITKLGDFPQSIVCLRKLVFFNSCNIVQHRWFQDRFYERGDVRAFIDTKRSHC